MDLYILDGTIPVLEPDLNAWGRWNRTHSKFIAESVFGFLWWKVRVSTVFLGIDHSFTEGFPVLFETMVFGGKHDGFQERSSTWSGALRTHADACALVKGRR